MLKHTLNRYPALERVSQQVYLNPYPKEQKPRNLCMGFQKTSESL